MGTIILLHVTLTTLCHHACIRVFDGMRCACRCSTQSRTTHAERERIRNVCTMNSVLASVPACFEAMTIKYSSACYCTVDSSNRGHAITDLGLRFQVLWLAKTTADD